MHPAPVISFTPLPHRPSPTVHKQQPAFLRTLHKFMPSFYRNGLPQVGNDESHDPLDVCTFHFFPLHNGHDDRPAVPCSIFLPSEPLPLSAVCHSCAIRSSFWRECKSPVLCPLFHINSSSVSSSGCRPIFFNHHKSPTVRLVAHSYRSCTTTYHRCSPCAG